VSLVGQVTDASPGGLTVQFTGVFNGTAVTAANGSFSAVGVASSTGVIQATATDHNDVTLTGQASVIDTAPTITNFQINCVSGTTYRFSGQVSAQAPAGMIVTFSGLSDVQGKTAIVNADGTFSVDLTLSSGDCGMVGAVVTDWYGLTSQTVY